MSRDSQPHDLRASFRRSIHPLQVFIPTLFDHAYWLEYELQVQDDNSRFSNSIKKYGTKKPTEQYNKPQHPTRPTNVCLGT